MEEHPPLTHPHDVRPLLNVSREVLPNSRHARQIQPSTIQHGFPHEEVRRHPPRLDPVHDHASNLPIVRRGPTDAQPPVLVSHNVSDHRDGRSIVDSRR
jgi:hypothetical protein